MNEMGIPAVGERLSRGSCRYREKTKLDRNGRELFDYGIHKLGFNVFQHINAADEISRLGLAILRKGRIKRMIVVSTDTELL